MSTNRKRIQSKIPVRSPVDSAPQGSNAVAVITLEDDDDMPTKKTRTLRSTTKKGPAALLFESGKPKERVPSTVSGSSVSSPCGLRRTPPISTAAGSSRGISQLQKLQAVAKLEFNNKETLRKANVVQFKGTGWVDRNFPKSVEELFVHKKKIEEIQAWLKSTLKTPGHPGRRVSKICVLTGPSGAGKTATVLLAAKEMDIEVKEWINPMSLSNYTHDRLGKFEPDEGFGTSQFDVFSNFLFRASQYSTLPMQGRKQSVNKLIVVEDFPNIFYRNADQFHNNILRPYASMGIFPVVFIIADSSSRDSNVYTLFPKTIMEELNMTCISFNAVATSFMVKFMTNICSKEGVSVDKSVIESIAAASGGDIRCAINTLQFKMENGNGRSTSLFKVPVSKKLPKSSSKQDKGHTNEDVKKDETVFLFRALGKVLYSKRDETRHLERDHDVPLSAHTYLRLHPLQENPEELLDKIGTQADMFLNLLQQNYIPFFGSIDDIVSASSLMADSEFILSRWGFDDSGTVSKNYRERETREQVALLVATRGLMYSNAHKTPNTFRAMKKSLFGDVRSRVQKSVDSVSQLFYGDGLTQMNFYSEMLPFYAKLIKRYPMWSKEKRNFITQIGNIGKSCRQRHHDTLNERDAEEEESDSEPDAGDINEGGVKNGLPLPEKANGSNSNDVGGQMLTNAEDAEEEFIIEDYDDDD